jgi:hypothetical protein
LLGTDLAVSSSHVIKDDSTGDKLTTTIEISFKTGTRVFIDDSSIDKNAVDLSLEGDINLPSHVKALGEFAIESTTPKNHSADVSLTANRIEIKFTKPISGSIMQDDWLSVDAYPVLDETQYLAEGSTFGQGSIPSVSGLTYSGNYVYATFNSALPKNAAVDVTVDDSVTATDGSEFGPNSYQLSFTTQRFPDIAGVHVIKREIKAATDELNDDYIAAMVLKNTIIRRIRGGASDTNASWAAVKWVINATIVDILDDKELEKALQAGTRRQLGDLNVSVDAVIGKLSLKHARAQKAMEEAEKTLAGSKLLAQKITNQFTSFYYGRPDRNWHGVNGKLIQSRFKYYQADQPAANTALNRNAKVPPNQGWL